MSASETFVASDGIGLAYVENVHLEPLTPDNSKEYQKKKADSTFVSRPWHCPRLSLRLSHGIENHCYVILHFLHVCDRKRCLSAGPHGTLCKRGKLWRGYGQASQRVLNSSTLIECFEGDGFSWPALELSWGEKVLFPEGVKEGCVLSLRVEVDPEATKARQRRAKYLAGQFFPKSLRPKGVYGQKA
jgi:hypothetical protein